MDLASLETINNQEESRFELWVDGHLAKIDYKIGRSGNIYLIHTEVAKEITQKGVANKIVTDALEWIRQQRMKMIPSCPYVKAYLKRNPGEYEDILADGVKLE